MRLCTYYILRPIAELLSMKNPDNSNTKRPRPTAILRTKALIAIPSLFWPAPAPALIRPRRPPSVAFVILAILAVYHGLLGDWNANTRVLHRREVVVAASKPRRTFPISQSMHTS